MIALSVVVALALAAAGPDADDRARAHFDAGVGLLDAKDFDGAAAAFKQSLEVKETLPALYNIALAYRGTKAFTKSRRALDRFLELTKNGGAPEVMVEKAKRLQEELATKVARVELVVRGGATAVMIDGERVADRDGKYNVEVDAGKHDLSVERAGYEVTRATRTVIEGSKETIELEAGQRPLPVRVELVTKPSEAQISVDGVPSGRTLELAPGPHIFEAKADGYTPAKVAFNVEAARAAKIELTLLPYEEDESVFGTWWFWTAVGVAVVGGTAAALAATIEIQGDPECGAGCVYLR